MPSKSSSSHSRWCDCPPTHRHAVYARWEPDDPGSPLLPITWCTRCHRLHGLSEFRKAVGLQGGERWITVHPGGGEEGNPVLIKPNPDGTHTIIGGAKGALNGLRLTAIKRQSEYQQEAKARHQEKRAAAKQADPVGYYSANYASAGSLLNQMLAGAPQMYDQSTADSFSGPVPAGEAAASATPTQAAA